MSNDTPPLEIDLTPEQLAKLMTPLGADAGESTCPVCGRTWLVTPRSDCLMPACGCFGGDASAANPARPCEPCGMRHAWNMPTSCAALAAPAVTPGDTVSDDTLRDEIAETIRKTMLGLPRRGIYLECADALLPLIATRDGVVAARALTEAAEALPAQWVARRPSRLTIEDWLRARAASSAPTPGDTP